MTAPRVVLDHHSGGQRATDRDARNRAYGIARLVPDAPVKSVFWIHGSKLLDQGQTGHCGGFALANEAQASPIRVPVSNEYAHGAYYEVKDRGWDPWGREDGTSTQAIMRVGQARGLWGGYAWGFGMADLYRQLQVGPVLAGTSWLTGMFTPNRDGVLSVSGQDEGGHLWLVTGRYTRYRGPSGKTYGPAIRMAQSWGPWGRDNTGTAVILEDEAEHVIFGLNGEVGVPTARAFPKA
jgi:hypothetical protein